ncbi:hypothetical protein BT63DRAFT_452961 [Microthyrium microscopicum]|uniref:Inhibitor I9 domain-containing protein n=1 Tax=Microthyrium microscopicum TaxID=703497 RepID=A0A6A6UJK5_9PEZI|nr:hypothetical protein BT63DRAFT_452961 [Microthyrium microscopicum]
MASRIAYVLLVILSLILLASAVKLPQKSVVISFPKDTPGHILDQAKEAITQAGGFITHEYKIFKGFAATAPVKAFDAVKALSAQYLPVIEEDQIITAQ